jgi:hypothetical protein
VREIKMVEPLSKQLSDLSIRAKNAEDAAAAAEKEAHDKIEARVSQARAAATAAAEKVDQAVKSAKDKTSRNWNALQTKIASDIDSLKSAVGKQQRKLDSKLAENDAERLEWDAGVAVDYAIASVEQAKLAVLDAIAGRMEAEQARKAAR